MTYILCVCGGMVAGYIMCAILTSSKISELEADNYRKEYEHEYMHTNPEDTYREDFGG